MLLALVLLQEVQDRMEHASNQDREEEQESDQEEDDQEESADGQLFYLD